MGWHTQPLMAFDVETTGLDVESTRIVTAAIWRIDPSTRDKLSTEWLIDPGVDIPAEATAVHGITTEHAQRHGSPPDQAVGEIIKLLAEGVTAEAPVVVFNAAFDLTVLDREMRRHGHAASFDGALRVIDPLVLDKHVDPYRRGSRTLGAMCGHYGIALAPEQAHGAAADALAAARLAWRLATRFPQLARMDPDTLHQAQVRWREKQAAGLQTHLRRTKNPDAVIDGSWPLVPFGGPQ